MVCANADTLAALLAGRLGEPEREAIANHAATCTACHQLLDRLVGATRSDRDVNHRDREPLRNGTRVGRYVIGDWLGVGGMGIVYAAVDSELQRKVAVKLLRPDEAGDFGTEGRERLMREARVLASLSHPNVVTVFDVGRHDGDLFLAMELVDGGSVNAWLAATPRAVASIVDCLIDAGRGIAAAHAAGIVHRDIKPDNVLVGSDGRARVTDFGLARLDHLADVAIAANVDLPSELSPTSSSADLTRTGARMGTPVYMAPEQHDGTADPRTDQWAFCAMVYELVAGVRPFPINDLDARAKAIAAGRLAPPSKKHRVPPWLMRVVARGLRARPDDRWPSMNAVVDALVRGRRRRGRIVAALVVAGVALAAVAFALVLRPGSAAPLPPTDTDIVLPDPRPGCGCPMSACDTTCASVCRASHYTVGEPIPGISLPGRQEALIGVSGDGNTIAYLANKGCRIDHLWVARRRGASYEPVDITAKLDFQHVALFEGCCTLAASGRAIVMARPDRRGFVRVRLDGDTPLPYDSTDELGAVVPGDRGHIEAQFPTLSADELTLYYRVFDRSLGDPSDLGPLEGTYAAHRADPSSQLDPGTLLPRRARFYDIVTGVSSDGLSLFMAAEYRTHVLVRPSVDKPFSDPDLGMLPALLPGWRAMPTADCRRIAVTVSPGGCGNEDIVFLEAAP